MREPKPAPDWLVTSITADPSSPANSAARSVTRASVLLGLLAVTAALPNSLGDTGWSHVLLAATAVIPLAAITIAAHRLRDERVESVAMSLLRRWRMCGLQGTVRSCAAEMFLRDDPLPLIPEERRWLERRLLVLVGALGLPPIAAWLVLAQLMVGPGLAGLTAGDALVLSLLWPAFVPVAAVLVLLFESVAQSMGCNGRVEGAQAPTLCAMEFGHDGECEPGCGYRRGDTSLLRQGLGDRCALAGSHDGDHLHLCGKRLGPLRPFKRTVLPCALPGGHDEDCRSLCSTPRCREVDGHEGEHAWVRSQPIHG